MTTLMWDKIGDRFYETGVDRGVLYLADNTGVAWNGLTSVEEDTSETTLTPYYVDSVKYFDHRSNRDFSGILKAYTYPDEFLQFDGALAVRPGFWAAEQPVYDTFGLSYRTRIGNDIDGPEYGYKIHLLYNLTSAPDNRAYPTLSSEIDPDPFSWKISGVPVAVPGFKPTTHFIMDSTTMNPEFISTLEDILYGTDSTTPMLPSPDEVITILSDIITEPITEPF